MFRKALKIIISSVLLAIFIMAILTFSLGLLDPYPVSKYTLKNEGKIIIFQEMRHVGQTNFYKEVHQEIINYKKEGFLYIYEGIFDIPEHNYYGTSPIFPNSEYMKQPFNLGNIDKNDINADFTYNEIVEKIEEKILFERGINQQSQKITTKTTSDNVVFYEYLKENSKNDIIAETEQNILQIRYYLNLLALFPDEEVIDTITGDEKEVIIDERDQLIVDTIIKSNQDKIYIHYGELHFHGFLKRLKKHDSGWQIVKTEKKEIL